MNDLETDQKDPHARHENGTGELRPRAVGSPLPAGDGGRASAPRVDPWRQQAAAPAPPAPGRALIAPPPETAAQGPYGFQRAAQMLRTAMPYVQKMLPLLDGNFATVVANVLAPQPHIPPPPPPQPPVDLEPLEHGLAELKMQQRDLRVQILDQNSSLKRVEDQLENVREATDRNTLEQQELIEDLKAVGAKVNLFAVVAMVLLVSSILLNVVLYLHIRHVFQ